MTSTDIDYRKTCKVGQYLYGRHRNMIGVWVYDQVSKDYTSAAFVRDFSSREEARAYVWTMNGWGTPTKPLAR